MILGNSIGTSIGMMMGTSIAGGDVPVVYYTVSWTISHGSVSATVDSAPIQSGSEVQKGKIVEFTIYPDSGYEYSTVPYPGHVVESYVVNDNISKTYSCTSSIPKVTVNFSTDHGSITATVDGSPIQSGSQVPNTKHVVFTVTPDSGYNLTNWRCNGSLVGRTDNPYDFNLGGWTGSLIMEAILEEVIVYHTVSWNNTNCSVSATVEGSSISSGAPVRHGKSVVFNITANRGYEYTGTNPETVQVNADVYRTFVATPIFHTVSWSNANCSVSATIDGYPIQSGSQVQYDKSVVFTITPDSDYTYSGTNPETVVVRNNITKSFVADWTGLKFKANTSGSSIDNSTGNNLEYSLNNGAWTSWSSGSVTLTNTNDFINVRLASGSTWGETTASKHFYMMGSVAASGNAMSLVSNTGFGSVTEIPIANCFRYLFRNCTSLTTSPSLPATTLKLECYYAMFVGCASLTTAPHLPAPTLVVSCYWDMFSGCSLINEIHCAATTHSALNATTDWLENVAAVGDFYCPSGVSWSTGNNGIPSGWTRHNEPALTYPVTFSCSHGSVSATVDGIGIQSGSDVEEGKTVVFTITPDTGYEYTGANPETVVVSGAVTKNYERTPTTPTFAGLKFTSTGDSTISLAEAGTGYTEYSTDNGSTWNAYTSGTTMNMSDGESICWRGNKNSTGSGIGRFTTSGSIEASGDITSLLNQTGGVVSLSNYGNYLFWLLFYGCSITTPPSLPSTTLGVGCYVGMFGRSDITSSPILNATNLVADCYKQMFYGCEYLSEIHCYATDISASNCTASWVSTITSNGDFYGKSAAGWTTGDNGIPSGWTAHLD